MCQSCEQNLFKYFHECERFLLKDVTVYLLKHAHLVWEVKHFKREKLWTVTS